MDGEALTVIERAQHEPGLSPKPSSALALFTTKAAALRCMGGQIQGRLLFRNDDERDRARRWGITDLGRKYTMEDMAGDDVIFAATGVTDGSLLQGVRLLPGGFYSTHTVVMRSKTKTVRWVKARHRRNKIQD